MNRDEFSAAFRTSPMKRAKLVGLQLDATFIIDTTGGALYDN